MGQNNLVLDPSFEECNYQLDENMIIHRSLHRSSYYIKTYSNDISNVANNTYLQTSCKGCYSVSQCNSGNYCAQLYMSSCMKTTSEQRSVIQGTLSTTLQIDSLYEFEMYICNNNAYKYNDIIPVYLSKDSIYCKQGYEINDKYLQKFEIPVEASTDWQCLRFRFQAQAEYNYFIIGELARKAGSKTNPEGNRLSGCLLIDDLSITQIASNVPKRVARDSIIEIEYYYPPGEFQIQDEHLFASLTFNSIGIDSIVVFSHADKQGEINYNISLSEKRSKSALNLLYSTHPEISNYPYIIRFDGESSCNNLIDSTCRLSNIKIYVYEKSESNYVPAND